ncbi:MAG: sporulation transcriptional regulator SpoIIID [Ruminococcaceae bacterium]|nr:sporulation transcriptional regulator SpoIIID [Oscillospiraceae bacterium]
MKDYISQRVLLLAEYIIENKATVRKAAKQFNISKSTVHKDITERLVSVNNGLAKEAKKVLEENKASRHIRGGMATKQKYENQKRGE